VSDPTKISADDLLAPPRERELPSERDADPDEAAELERVRTHRWGRVVSIADAYRAKAAAGAFDPLQRDVEAFHRRQREWRNRERGPELGVSREDGVLDFAVLDAPPRTAALDAVREALAWRAGHGPHRPLVLALLGSTGSGKSVALGWAVLHHDRSARQVAAADVPRRVEHSEAKAERARLLAVDLLAVDEIGGRSDEQPAHVLDLVLERYNAGRVTLLAGNVTAAHFKGQYADERLASRLRRQQADGQRVVVQLAATDMRKRSGR
jgi:hypothetical protein